MCDVILTAQMQAAGDQPYSTIALVAVADLCHPTSSLAEEIPAMTECWQHHPQLLPVGQPSSLHLSAAIIKNIARLYFVTTKQ